MKYRIDNIVINADHIVTVEYYPESSGIDDETDKPYHLDSKATITLSAIERDVLYGWEGRIDGVGSKSQVVEFRGSDADRFWDAYAIDAYQVVV